LLNLLLNENMKIYRRLRTWMLVAGLILITAVTLIFVQNHIASMHGGGGGDWKANVRQQIEGTQSQLAKKDTPDDRKAELQADLLVNQYRLEHDIPPTENTLWGNVLTASNLIVFVTMFTVIVAADSVAGEFSSGTIKLLLIRPVSRSKVLLSKYISTLIFSLFQFLMIFASAFILSGMLVGFGDVWTPYLYTQDGAVHEVNMVRHVLSTYGYECVQLIIIVTMAFMISTVFRSSSLAIGFSIGIMFVGSAVANFLTSFSWAKYFLFENTDLTVYLNGTPKIAGMTLSFSIAVLIVHYVIFMAASWLVFTRRDVAS